MKTTLIIGCILTAAAAIFFYSRIVSPPAPGPQSGAVRILKCRALEREGNNRGAWFCKCYYELSASCREE